MFVKSTVWSLVAALAGTPVLAATGGTETSPGVTGTPRIEPGKPLSPPEIQGGNLNNQPLEGTTPETQRDAGSATTPGIETRRHKKAPRRPMQSPGGKQTGTHSSSETAPDTQSGGQSATQPSPGVSASPSPSTSPLSH